MSLTDREFWTVMHGMVFGAVFLLTFAGAFAGLYSLRPELLTMTGVRERLGRIRWGTTIMTLLVWATVISGTFAVYIWYRAAPPEGTTDLAQYPRSLLLADESLSGWHTFGMEWKEHVAWISPIVLTAITYIVWRYGRGLAGNRMLRIVTMTLLAVGFATAAVAGVLGALITKAAPIT
jgi:hypothetical protein